MGGLFDLYDPAHEFNEYDDPNGEWRRRVELEREKEPRLPRVVRPHRRAVLVPVEQVRRAPAPTRRHPRSQPIDRQEAFLL
jgi:hypothetical protein